MSNDKIGNLPASIIILCLLQSDENFHFRSDLFEKKETDAMIYIEINA
jgi:hypothetical protein